MEPSTPPRTAKIADLAQTPACALKGSSFLPGFLKQIARDDVKTVLLAGCGGGFDFVHSMALFPELHQLGKKVIIGSYSFGQASGIRGPQAEVVFSTDDGVLVKKVNAHCTADRKYGPEVHVCSYLDVQYPAESPHWMYAYYARAFTPEVLRQFYQAVVDTHGIDAVVLVDGGSDSLMRGDEAGLGDPVEDAVSIGAVSLLTNVKVKVLLNMGVGCDRFNGVSDCATLRAVSELAQKGGFLGSVAMEPTTLGFVFYKGLVKHIFQQQQFHSVIAGSIVAAGEGYYGDEEVPENLRSRVKPGELFLWPLMSFIFGFDLALVAQRSLLVPRLLSCASVTDCYEQLSSMRAQVSIKPTEHFPGTSEDDW